MSDRTEDQPVQRTFLHIGSFKSGTSFIQSVLLRNRDLLATDDVCFPTDKSRRGLQIHAAKDVVRRKPGSGLGNPSSRLVETIMTSGRMTAVVSVERLSLATPAQAKALVRGLEPSEVHVILTLRDLARVLPSDWQSKIKQGNTWSFDDYTAAAAERNGKRRKTKVFWQHHDATGIAKRWLKAVDPDRFHIVTVPPVGAPASLLWERFCSVLGIDPGRYDISQDAKSNFSLSYSDTEFLRQVNRAVGRTMNSGARKQWVTRYLANKLLRPDSDEPARVDRPRLDPVAAGWVDARSAEIVAALRELEVDVVGDLDELIPDPRPAGDRPSEPAEAYPERAAVIVAALLSKLAVVDDSSPGSSARGNTKKGPASGGAGSTSRASRRAGPKRGQPGRRDAGDAPASADQRVARKRSGQRRRRTPDSAP